MKNCEHEKIVETVFMRHSKNSICVFEGVKAGNGEHFFDAFRSATMNACHSSMTLSTNYHINGKNRICPSSRPRFFLSNLREGGEENFCQESNVMEEA
jgi:hypothetical protein